MAIAVCVLGLSNFVSPQIFMQILSIGVMMIIVGLQCAGEGAVFFADDLKQWQTVTLGCGAATVAGAAAVVGSDGFQMLVGAVLAIFLVHTLGAAASVGGVGVTSATDATVLVPVSVLFAALGAGSMYFWRSRMSEILGVLTGSFLTSCGAGFIFTSYTSSSAVDFLAFMTSLVTVGSAKDGSYFLALGIWVLLSFAGCARMCPRRRRRSKETPQDIVAQEDPLTRRGATDRLKEPLMDVEKGRSKNGKRSERQQRDQGHGVGADFHDECEQRTPEKKRFGNTFSNFKMPKMPPQARSAVAAVLGTRKPAETPESRRGDRESRRSERETGVPTPPTRPGSRRDRRDPYKS